MKYIRTLTGITRAIDTDDIDILKYQEMISIKQSNNIEDLCDVFIVMCEEYKKPFIWDNVPFNEIIDFYKVNSSYKHIKFFYGAIFINGKYGELIIKSVAKMNENYVLDLLG